MSVINFTVWFAITFWVYLETRSVLATGMVAGIFLVATSLSGIWFGSLVDHYRKKTVMQISAATSLVLFGVSFAVYLLAPGGEFPRSGERDPVGLRRAGDARRHRRQHPDHRACPPWSRC